MPLPLPLSRKDELAVDVVRKILGIAATSALVTGGVLVLFFDHFDWKTWLFTVALTLSLVNQAMKLTGFVEEVYHRGRIDALEDEYKQRFGKDT